MALVPERPRKGIAAPHAASVVIEIWPAASQLAPLLTSTYDGAGDAGGGGATGGGLGACMHTHCQLYTPQLPPPAPWWLEWDCLNEQCELRPLVAMAAVV